MCRISTASKDSGFVSRETSNRLDRYIQLVRKWQKSINLIAPSTVADIETRHIDDSLQLFRLSPEPKTWLDMGSGAGFPGLVTAIMLAEKGEGWVHLCEKSAKKAAFLRQVIAETGACASVHALRLEDIDRTSLRIDAISARALASLDELLAMAYPWAVVNPNLICWFHKGLEYGEEVRSARDRWSFDLVEHPSAVLEGSVILQISNVKKQDRGPKP